MARLGAVIGMKPGKLFLYEFLTLKNAFMFSWAGIYPLREKITAMTTRLKTTTKAPPSHTRSSFCFMRIKPPTVSRFGPPGGPFISRVGINLVSGGNDSGVLGSENS